MIKLFINKASVQRARDHIKQTEAKVKENDPHAHHSHNGMKDESHVHQQQGKIKEKGKDAAGYFYMDVKMVGKDILIGVLIAAVLSVVVPQHFWQSLFLQNETDLPEFVIILWNSLFGIIVALLAFVCSVGNILLAAVLWHGGINFGGVIAFILADLITIPMLMVYRRYYGIKMMWRLLLVLALAILATGIGVDYIFQWTGWIPQSHGKQMSIQMEGIQWDYKAILNIIFVPLSVIGFFIGKKAMKKGMM